MVLCEGFNGPQGHQGAQGIGLRGTQGDQGYPGESISDYIRLSFSLEDPHELGALYIDENNTIKISMG